ncbi:MAG: ABC transporter ATP-binding protein [Saprospiraceae bacterium]|nr:ABC transporter ATP-binding protein [Lewinella sp.]
MVELIEVAKIYQSQAETLTALKGITFQVGPGEAIAITGESGSGKSTLLNVVAGIDRPDEGVIRIAGQELDQLSEKELALWRGRNIGIVFQFYQLFPSLSALDNILLAMDVVDCLPKTERSSRAWELLAQVGLQDKGRKFPAQLSGGEQQRVAIARALANDPPLLVADEPTGNLDRRNGDVIQNLFFEMVQRGKSLIMVTHADVSGQSFDRVIHLEDGKLIDKKETL